MILSSSHTGRTQQRSLTTYRTFCARNFALRPAPKAESYPSRNRSNLWGTPYPCMGLRLRRRTTRHIKRSLKHVSHMYAEGNCDLDDALHTTNSYWGLTKSCNGYGLRRWIENNIAFERKDEGKEMPEMSERPEEKLALAAAPQKTENNSEEASLASEQDSPPKHRRCNMEDGAIGPDRVFTHCQARGWHGGCVF